MKKVSELIGEDLDRAVAICFNPGVEWGEWKPSTDWRQGGAIIEMQGIRIHRSHTGTWWASAEATPSSPVDGSTALIAAMRCYVSSLVGDDWN